MRAFTLRRLVCSAAVAALVCSGPRYASARDMASPAPVDCSKAGAMMDQAAKAAPPAMTGSVDRDTLMMMQMHASMTMQMAQIEASCGKDPKQKAAAAQLLTDSIDLVNRIQRLTSPTP